MSDAVLTLTNAEKMTLIELGVQEERIHVTGNGPILNDQAHPEEFLAINSISGPMVLFLGQHYRYKGYRQTLEAARLVWQRFPEIHFVFIGPSVGSSEKYFQALSDRRINRLIAVDQQVKTDFSCLYLVMRSVYTGELRRCIYGSLVV